MSIQTQKYIYRPKINTGDGRGVFTDLRSIKTEIKYRNKFPSISNLKSIFFLKDPSSIAVSLLHFHWLQNCEVSGIQKKMKTAN
jgi:hypothetical protein